MPSGAIASGAGLDQPDMAEKCRRPRRTSPRIRRRPRARPATLLPPQVDDVGEVVAEAAVAAFVMADEVAVVEDAAIAEGAVELQPEASVLASALSAAGRCAGTSRRCW